MDILDWMARGFRPRVRRSREYETLDLDARQIAGAEYKRYLGGGALEWEARGARQLALMRSLGLTPNSKLLDVGCGPLRAGEHFIRFLEAGNYTGFDRNESLVRSAEHVVSSHNLSPKRPRILHIEDFDLTPLRCAQFDFMLAYSVLNHCGEHERRSIFRQARSLLLPGGRFVVTHVRWLQQDYLDGTGLLIDTATLDPNKPGMKVLRRAD